MKLQHTIICSLALHVVLLGFAWLSPLDEQVITPIDGWEDMDIKPVTFKTIVLPKKVIVEIEVKLDTSPEKLFSPKKSVAKATPKPKIKKKRIARVPKKVLKKLDKKEELKKTEPLKIKTKKIVSVVVSKDAGERKTVSKQIDAIVKSKDMTGQLAIATKNTVTKTSNISSKEASNKGSVAEHSGNARVDVRGLVRGYNRAVYKTINKRKRYPMIARRMRLQGKVYIEVTIDSKGKIKMARIKKSSGHRVLDQEALKTIKNIKVLPMPPSALGWTTRRMTIPMVYRFS